MNRNLRIVIVDDIEETRTNIRLLLTLCDGVEVVGEAADGLAALSVSRQTKPDCVLMDVNMPKMDGFEATQVLLREMPHVAVVIMSVEADPEYRRQAYACGARAYIEKPIELERLTSILAEIGETKVSV